MSHNGHTEAEIETGAMRLEGTLALPESLSVPSFRGAGALTSRGATLPRISAPILLIVGATTNPSSV